MLKYDELSEDQKKLYDSLKGAIQNNSNVVDVLEQYKTINMASVLSAAKSDEDILMVYAIKENVETAKAIFNYAEKLHKTTQFADQTKMGDVTDILAEKALGAILADNNENEIAKKIIDFSTQVGDRSIANKLTEEFKKAVKSGDFEKANKFYAFGERNQTNIFKDWLLRKDTWLSDTIAEIKHNKNTKFLENTLEFAENNKILDEVFKAKIGSTQKTLLEFAEEKGVKKKVEEVIRDAGINISQYENAASSLDKNQKILNFLCENKGKIACGVVGSLFLIGGIVAASTLGQPLIGAVAIGATVAGAIGAFVGAAMMLVSVLAITTDRGYEMWGSADKMLSDLFISQQGPKEPQI